MGNSHDTHSPSGARDPLMTPPARSGGIGRRWIVVGAVVVALILVGVFVTAAFLSAGPPAAAPTPSATATATPSPSASPNESPAASPVALAGRCEDLLGLDEAAEILGGEVEVRHQVSVHDPALIGGLSCVWGSTEQWWSDLWVGVYPIAVVPASVQELDAIVPACDGGECAYAERFGDAWVVASGAVPEQVVRAVAVMGPRAEREPGIAGAVPPGSWAVPPCDELRAVMSEHLGRGDLEPYVGDAHPAGREWDVLTENGLTWWCGTLGGPQGNLLELIEVFVAPGGAGPSSEALAADGMTALTVPNARAAWISPAGSQESRLIAAVTDRGAVLIGARFLDEQTLAALTGAVIEHLDERAR